MQQTILVVGNKFKNLAKAPAIFTYQQFLEKLTQLASAVKLSKYDLYLGQGLSDQQSAELLSLIQANTKLKAQINLQSYSPPRSNKRFTHKQMDENILISDPFQINQHEYAAYLMVNDQCAEMSDHVTGQHLQGMVLIEAARQLTLAVTEKYFIADQERENVGFVTEQLQTQFKQYAFPVETFMHYHIKKIRGKNGLNRSYQVTITFYQNNQAITEINYQFSTFIKAYLQQQEIRAVDHVINNISSIARMNHDVVAA